MSGPRAITIQMPSELVIELTPGSNGEAGQAQLRARAWISFVATDLRIIPARGDVHYNKETGTFKIEITLAALRTKPPPEPPLIIMP
jgi:hypothetical protein